MGEAYSTNRQKRNPYLLLVGKLDAERSLGIPRHCWMDLGEIGWGGGVVLAGLVWLRIGTNRALL
jgi:hypothetical protein